MNSEDSINFFFLKSKKNKLSFGYESPDGHCVVLLSISRQTNFQELSEEIDLFDLDLNVFPRISFGNEREREKDK